MYVAAFCLVLTPVRVWAEEEATLTLNDAITIAKEHSTQAKINNYLFLSNYWAFRSYKAQLLPSFNLNAGLGNYNRSIVEVRNYETGEIKYVTNNSLNNDISLSIDQNIPFTGGKISLVSYLSRLDQFDKESGTLYNSNPLIINYTQPLRAFNELKWQKKMAPKQYESSKKKYLESMQEITIETTSLYFKLLSAKSDYQNAIKVYEDTKTLFEITKHRLQVGDVTRSDYLQLELALLNSEFDISNYNKLYDMSRFDFCIYLGIPYNIDLNLLTPTPISGITIQYDEVLNYAYQNSSFTDENELKLLQSEQEVAKAKSLRGVQIALNANIGLSQSGDTFQSAYNSLKDQEVVGVSLQMPIYDWGLSKGNVKMAEAQQAIIQIDLERTESRYRQDIFIKVLSFEDAAKLCSIMERACAIADERYTIIYEKFKNGTVNVTELNIARQEKDDAQKKYLGQLKEFWNSYFEIQKITLYDYINKKSISEDFDKMTEQ